MLCEFEDDFLEELDRNLSRYSSVNHEEVYACIEDRKPIKAVVDSFEFFRSNSDFLKVLTSENGDHSFTRRLQTQYRESYNRYLIQGRPTLMDELDQYYTLYFESSAAYGVIIGWIRGGCKESPEEMCLRSMDMLYRVAPVRPDAFA